MKRSFWSAKKSLIISSTAKATAAIAAPASRGLAFAGLATFSAFLVTLKGSSVKFLQPEIERQEEIPAKTVILHIGHTCAVYFPRDTCILIKQIEAL